MKLKFTYVRSGGEAIDLIATMDSKARVGDLAEHLVGADPHRSSRGVERPTLCVIDRNNQMLDPAVPLTDSPLRSGVRVSVLPSSRGYAERGGSGPVAILRVVEGPDASREFPLAAGSVVVGREDCDVTLSDPLVSRQHLRLNVSDIVEIHDLGSANGTSVGDQPVSHASLRSSDVVEIGETLFTVRLVHAAPVSASTDLGTAVSFVRSPVIVPRYDGATFTAPQAPERARPQRMPLVTLLVPIVMAAVLWVTTHQVLAIIFAALSPLMLVGGVLESRRAAKADYKEALAAYEDDLQALADDLDAALVAERHTRDAEQPSVATLVQAARQQEALLWSRRPGDDDFMSVRLGRGTLPSRTTVEVPPAGRAQYDVWMRAVSMTAARAQVEDVPVVTDLRRGALGVAGPRRGALPIFRAVIAQAVSLHSPAELAVTALVSPETARDWDWLKWLPHTSAPQSPIGGRHLATGPADGGALVSALEEIIARRDDDYLASAADPAVLLVVEVDQPADHSRVVQLAENGAPVGVHVVWLAPDRALLPAACRTFVSVAGDGSSTSVGVVEEHRAPSDVTPETVELEVVEDLARRLSPLIDLGARVLDSSDIPRNVSQLSMLGTRLGEESHAVVERWLESSSILTGPRAPQSLPRRAANLRAVLGQSPTGPHTIDLRTDGPHALVGGTTGAGKSELLQSWVLALAAAHSPQRVTFLFVDYKGGAAFAECEHLPHSLGVVTDLRPHLVRRALSSLKAELRYREELLAAHQAKDLMQMERRGRAEAPPSLVIVVDEFAALVKEVPEFVDGVVDVAQRGRSLGLHLILATQRPAGVIKDNLRANTNLRIALRMADAEDSTDVLGSPDAASFDPELPGRAMSKAGPRAVVPFQASYAGGWTSPSSERPEVFVEELSLTDPRAWEVSEASADIVRDEESTDIRRLVGTIRGAAEVAGLPLPRRVWMPDLPAVLDLADLDLEDTDENLVFGRLDHPDRQAQPDAVFRPDREGHMVFFGTSGSGKSTALRTVAISAGYAAVWTPVQVHAIDFGSRGLSTLEVLPHVGSVIAGQDHERIVRLLTMLRDMIDERATRFASARAANLTEYRRLSGRAEPRVLLLLDGLPAFRSAYETGDRQRWADMFASILADGRPVGVHVVMSSDQRSGLSPAIAAAVQRRVVLRMAVPDDYVMLGVAADVLDSTSVPGRGLDGKREVQVAILGQSPDVLAQSERMAAFGRKMTESGVVETPEVGSLPDLVSVADLDLTPGLVSIGIAGETLSTLAVEPSGGFLLTGPSGSGRSTSLQSLVGSARRSVPRLRWHFLGQKRSPLAGEEWWETSCTAADAAAQWADELTEEIKSYEVSSRRAAIVIESAGDHVNSLAEMSLQAMVRAALADGHWVIVEGEASTIITGVGFVGLVKASRQGVALQPDQEMGGLFKTPFPRVNRVDFPVGRGLYVRNGRTSLVQIAVPWEIAGDEG